MTFKNRPPAADAPAGEKLQKVLARAGAGSRREMERWIEQGRVTIDGRPAKLGDRVGPEQILRIDGRVLPKPTFTPKPRVLVYHKPEGEVTTRNDPEGRPTVFDNLPTLRNSRWIAIGRLDMNSSGLMLFTTDGDLAHRLMHPSAEIEREYAVRVLGAVTPEMIKQLTEGVTLEDGPARFESVADAGGTGANHWYHVVIREGRNREVRRMWEAVGATVSRLIRVRYGVATLPRLVRPGRFDDLDKEVMDELYRSVDLRPPTAPKKSSSRVRSAAPIRGRNNSSTTRRKPAGADRRKRT
ncbi:MAG: 23S rRNA pseudouridine(2605) synthase RluB [Gammaproteobacteria bacterium]|nr:23S rRNA pseudouridine(2605) synthase RluB [Gammaproteobacteria bacterium]